MTDAQIIVDKMLEIYGDKIVDPDVFPRIFKYQVMMTQREIKFEQAAQPPAET